MRNLKLFVLKSTVACAMGAALACATAAVSAQTVYRIVGPDGRVTFSDKPPVTPDAKAAVLTPGARGQEASGTALPLDVRQAVGRYPVTLYAGPNCGPCSSGRSFLNARGIPFSEKTVTTVADIAALQRIAGEASLPFLTIGTQKLKGFSDVDWGQTLDAAGYPATSKLPANFRNPAATALVNVDPSAENAVQQAAANAQQPPATPPEVPVQSPTTNPAGIRF